MLGANLGLLLYGEVSVMNVKNHHINILSQQFCHKANLSTESNVFFKSMKAQNIVFFYTNVNQLNILDWKYDQEFHKIF